MTNGRNQSVSKDSRCSAQRIRLPSKRDSQLGKSLRLAYNGESDASMPKEFEDLLAQLA